MKKVAIFGKPGSGKSTLGKKLAAASGIEIYPLDSILYKSNGEQVELKQFNDHHENILSYGSWIIDGFGTMESFNKRLEAADTLIYIDLTYLTSYWFVTKRLLKGVISKPEGWPEGSSLLKGTMESYKVLRLCPKFWNDDLLQRLEKISHNKSLHVIRSATDLNRFIETNL